MPFVTSSFLLLVVMTSNLIAMASNLVASCSCSFAKTSAAVFVGSSLEVSRVHPSGLHTPYQGRGSSEKTLVLSSCDFENTKATDPSGCARAGGLGGGLARRGLAELPTGTAANHCKPSLSLYLVEKHVEIC